MEAKPARAKAFDARLMFARIGLAGSGFNSKAFSAAFSAGLGPSCLDPFTKTRQGQAGLPAPLTYFGNTLSSALF